MTFWKTLFILWLASPLVVAAIYWLCYLWQRWREMRVVRQAERILERANWS